MLPSSKVPVAVNVWFCPDAMRALVGVIAMLASFDVVTVTEVEPLIVLDAAVTVAVTVAVPAATPVTTPAAETVAIDGSDDDHVTPVVSVFVL